jgi:hypothetical protein
VTGPEVRARLRELALVYADLELLMLAEELNRRQNGKRAPRAHRRMSPELKQAICAYRELEPDATQMAIAKVFDVHPGRVSEALYGKRT